MSHSVAIQHHITLLQLKLFYSIAGLIIGGGVILLLLGWCCLFVYFNTCGRVSFVDQRRKEELYEEKMDERLEENDERQLGQVKDERKEMRTSEKINVHEEER